MIRQAAIQEKYAHFSLQELNLLHTNRNALLRVGLSNLGELTALPFEALAAIPKLSRNGIRNVATVLIQTLDPEDFIRIPLSSQESCYLLLYCNSYPPSLRNALNEEGIITMRDFVENEAALYQVISRFKPEETLQLREQLTRLGFPKCVDLAVPICEP